MSKRILDSVCKTRVIRTSAPVPPSILESTRISVNSNYDTALVAKNGTIASYDITDNFKSSCIFSHGYGIALQSYTCVAKV